VNSFVAGFVGSPAMNFLEGRLAAANGSIGLVLKDGTNVSLEGYEFAGRPGEGRPTLLGIRPEQVDLTSQLAGASHLPLKVSLIDPMGADSLVWGTVGKETISVRVGGEDSFAVGSEINASFLPEQISLFDG